MHRGGETVLAIAGQAVIDGEHRITTRGEIRRHVLIDGA